MSNTGKKKSSWQLYAILVVTIVPIVAAYLAYYTGIGVPEDTVNEGTLLTTTKNIQDLYPQASGELPVFEENKNWRWFIPITFPCNELCQEQLYLTRQVHIRLGEKAERVERYAINLAGQDGEAYLASIAGEHPKLKHFSVDASEYAQWAAGSNLPVDLLQDPYVLLVDQVGFVALFYDNSNDGNQILKDIKRVLRYSPE